MDLVLPVRNGGLGNQLFQVAAAVIYSQETGKQVVLPKEMPHIHKNHPFPYEESVFSGFPTLATPLDKLAIYSLCMNGFTVYPGEPGFEAWDCKPIQGNLVLQGYFQYYPPIERHTSIIVSTFLNGLKAYIQEDSEAVAIHVRRGDYLKFTDVFSIVGSTYYRKAIEEMERSRSGEKIYKIFSDDIEWCKEQEVFTSLSRCEFIDEPDEIKSLSLMIACKGGCICANSTFSWWGAYLGAHQVGSPCIVPEQWMKGFTGDLIPNKWIRISIL